MRFKADASETHCAFTGKARRFPKMMKPFGYKTIMYANEGADSGADETVVMHSKEEFDLHYPKQKPQEFHGDYARHWPVVSNRMI